MKYFLLYHYKDIHLCKLKLIELILDKKLVYQVLDNLFSFTEDKSEWINTKLIFNITSDGDKTNIQFTTQVLSRNMNVTMFALMPGPPISKKVFIILLLLATGNLI